MDKIKKKLKEKIKAEIKKSAPNKIISSFFISVTIIDGLLNLYWNSNMTDELISIIISVGIILATVCSINFRALLLVVISIIYYIAKSLIYIFIVFPDKLVSKYSSLDKKYKIIIKIGALFAGGILAKKIFDNIANSELKGGEKGDHSFVNPHEVNGYTRKDGSRVDSYWRDGDGNPLTKLTKKNGGGYIRKK